MGVLLDKFTTKTSIERGVKSDFIDGLLITEFDRNGKALDSDRIQLVGAFMPKDSFDFGGSQRIVKEFYSGSSEPTVQVLGPEEDDITIRGEFNTRMLRDSSLSEAAVEYQELVDAMRLRGNLVLIQLGEWKRYGFIAKCKFQMKTLRFISYEITFAIVGFNAPKGYYLVDGQDGDLTAPNKDLTNAVALHLQKLENAPTSLPVSINDVMRDSISDVAEKIAEVTGFISGVVTDAEKLNATALRAVGLIKNARSFISSTARRIGNVETTTASLGSLFSSESDKTLYTVKNVEYIHDVQRSNKSLAKILSEMQKKYESFISTIPLRRHLVIEGETLQTISVKYYGVADHWMRVMEHNKLQTADISRGLVLQIPRI